VPNKLFILFIYLISRTIPFLKKDNKDDLSNFRPIGLINGFFKIFEKILHKRML